VAHRALYIALVDNTHVCVLISQNLLFALADLHNDKVSHIILPQRRMSWNSRHLREETLWKKLAQGQRLNRRWSCVQYLLSTVLFLCLQETLIYSSVLLYSSVLRNITMIYSSVPEPRNIIAIDEHSLLHSSVHR
jgi:hypothetical protein